MKAITLAAPWAWAVAHAGKDVENRKTRCPSLLGERIAIHAGVAPSSTADHVRDADALLWIWQRAGVIPNTGTMGPDSGCVVAVATIIGWVEGRTVVSAPDYEAEAVCHDGAESRWFMGPIGWLLHDVRTLATPIPARGKQGIWTVDADAEARILAQIGGA
jgi:hypothetical protein